MNRRQLYYGDNLDILRKHIPDETVDLCYIDPPFNSKRSYNQIYNNIIGAEDKAQSTAFLDTWGWNARTEQEYNEICANENGSFTKQTSDLIIGLYNILGKGSLLAYVISMTLRINEIHRVLKPTGSFYLHCDPTVGHYLKIVLDAIFGYANFRSEIIWRRTSSHNKTSKQYGPIHDVILFYSRSDKFTFHPGTTPYSKAYIAERFKYNDNRGIYRLSMLTGPGIRNGESGKEWRGFNPTSNGRHWAIPKSLRSFLTKNCVTTLDCLECLYKQELIVFPKKDGGQPVYKQYVGDGVTYQDIWAYQPNTEGVLIDKNLCIDGDVKYLGNEEEQLGYPTQKPMGLLERIIKTSSNEGDVVLDAFCGCGTTVAVAQKLGRQWIGVDITYNSISLILKRLTDAYGDEIMNDITISGIPADIESAKALAFKKDDRLRKEFEKWAILTYSDNRAMINDKKGKDYGIDGTARVLEGRDKYRDALFSVKSGKVNSSMIRDFRGVIERENAAAGIFITLNEPTKDMKQEAAVAGVYNSEYMQDIDKIQIVTIGQILKGERLGIPLAADVLKKAGMAVNDNQMTIF